MIKETEFIITLSISVMAESKHQAKLKVLEQVPECYNLHAIVG